MLNKFTVTGSDFKRLQLLPLKYQSIEGYITLHNVLHNLMRVLIIAPISGSGSQSFRLSRSFRKGVGSQLQEGGLRRCQR